MGDLMATGASEEEAVVGLAELPEVGIPACPAVVFRPERAVSAAAAGVFTVPVGVMHGERIRVGYGARAGVPAVLAAGAGAAVPEPCEHFGFVAPGLLALPLTFTRLAIGANPHAAERSFSTDSADTVGVEGPLLPVALVLRAASAPPAKARDVVGRRAADLALGAERAGLEEGK
jgi:hypothetical protein